MNLEQLKNYCQNFNLLLDEEMLQKFDIYADFLIEENKKYNLTAITKKEEIIEKHFYDSLLLLKYIDDDISIADVGSGAGFPGVPIAIANNSLDITLIEPIKKRCFFLNELKEKLALGNVKIINARAEDYVKINREIFDVVTARAVSNLPILCEVCIPLVKIGGKFISMKGSQGINEATNSIYALETLGCSKAIIKKETLVNDDQRVFVIATKVKATALKYPRAYGQIKKKPLVRE